MSQLKLVCFDSLAALRSAASPWDDLWDRSEVTLPTVRAELIAQWVEQFRPGARLRALAVEDQGQLAAALPLVGLPLGRGISAGGLPCNQWSPCGDLLLDPQADAAVALDTLAKGLGRLPWPLLWLDGVRIERPGWLALLKALERNGLSAHYRQRFRAAAIRVAGPWAEHRRRWSKSHRRKMRKSLRRLRNDGALSFRMEWQLEPQQVPDRLWRGFEVEDRSWKGRAGSSVLRTAQMPQFYTRQAAQLACWGQLVLAFLELEGRPIAFEYGWNAKGVYHSLKIGYDEQYAAYSPGHVLMCHLLERLHSDRQLRWFDCLGPLSAAEMRWRPATYGVGRLVVAPPRPLGQTLLWGYKHLWPLVRKRPGSNGRRGNPNLGRIAAKPARPTASADGKPS